MGLHQCSDALAAGGRTWGLASAGGGVPHQCALLPWSAGGGGSRARAVRTRRRWRPCGGVALDAYKVTAAAGLALGVAGVPR